MSTTIHRYRITNCSVNERSTKEIFDYCFGFSEIDFYFEDWFDRFGVTIEDSENATFDSFFSVVSENYSKKGLPFFDLIFRLYKAEFENLRQGNNSATAEALLWHHILADLSVDGFKRLPIKELTIGIVQVEGGIVTFPKEDNAESWGVQYREFLIRMLANLPKPNTSIYPISEWFENKGVDLYDGVISNTEIIWGVKEEDRIRITDHTSWDEYTDYWWKDLMNGIVQYQIENNGEDFEETLEEYPLEVVTVKVLISDLWFPNIEEYIKNNTEFDSTAYYTN